MYNRKNERAQDKYENMRANVRNTEAIRILTNKSSGHATARKRARRCWRALGRIGLNYAAFMVMIFPDFAGASVQNFAASAGRISDR